MNKILLINTAEDFSVVTKISEELSKRGTQHEVVDAKDMKIHNCVGCNYCWLKTPGKCVFHDDYEGILVKIMKADQVWLVTDASFGFVTYKTKNLLDRIMPLLTMNLCFVDGQMRHVMRYDKNPDWGVVYCGDGDKAFLDCWCDRVATNFGTRSLGAFSQEELQEAIACAQ